MLIPAVGFIKMALETLEQVSPDDAGLLDELAEFKELGIGRVSQLRNSPGMKHLTDLQRGYLIGLETARTLLRTNPTALKDGITL